MEEPKTIMADKKEYIFRDTVSTTEDTTVMANSYDEAVDLYLSGEGATEEVSSNVGNWDCIQNADDFEDDITGDFKED